MRPRRLAVLSGGLSASVLLAIFLLANACHPMQPAPMHTTFPLAEPNTVTYVGHATVLLRLHGVAILTDPVYGEYVGIYRRYVRPGVPFDALPPLDVILISHGHWDHFDRSTLRRIDKGTVVVVPDGLQATVRGLGFRDVRGLKPWDSTTVRGTGFTAVPARHFGTSCGYLVRNGKTVYFAGDTGLFEGMRAIGRAGSIDLALLPIGAYRPHVWFIPGASRAMRRVHMAPEDVPAATAMLGAKLVVPIHWGTFKLTGEPIDEPVERLQRVLAQRSLADSVRLVLPGETVAF